MAAIGTPNVPFPAFRNSIVGNTADYTTRVNLDTDTLYAFFTDEATTAADEGFVFQVTLVAAENPSYANRLSLTSTTVPTTNTVAACGFFDAADATFTGSSVLTGTTSVEKLIIGKRQASAATDPLLYHFGTATGLPLTPNGADVTVVWNASGIARH
jgi:hypothetical protein